MEPIDLTRRIEPGMPVYPGDPGVSAESSATMQSDGYRVTHLSFTTHVGTHIDAPAHMEPEGSTLDEYDVGDFRFDARLVDLTGERGDGGLDAREPIEPGTLPDGTPDADMLVLRTGWGDHWGDDRYFDHPYLTPGAARHVADLDCAVGLDTINPDPTPTERAGDDEPAGTPAHHELLGAGAFIVENLDLTADLPERFTLRAYPLRVDGDGAPVRAVAERSSRAD
ncbi:cyclase family protein [Halobaculum sp. WSA2]|uniref:Cyclase family protein n=1 Tax=Halobaculum saliterrae TaxID=2073113 RepID=A0A6B0SUK2_9EURY|nr:cyclase family protein [Halobaculum saliterrae]MXR42658.1 cyclase family protein [Halobaculum saliterrae]